MHTHCTS